MNRSILRRICLPAALLAILAVSVAGHQAAAGDRDPAPVAKQTLDTAPATTAAPDPTAEPGATTEQAEPAQDGEDVWSPDTSPTQMACGDRRCSGSLQCCWYQRCSAGRCVAW